MTEITNVEGAIRDYLPTVIHMSLATSKDNKPWVCEVHFAFDDELNLYFRSTDIRRHSQEIALNPQVAGNIVAQHRPGEKVRGVYFEGTAEKLTSTDELSPAYIALNNRFNLGTAMLEDAALDGGHKFYKITVADWYVFDTRESVPAQKYHLKR